MYNYWRPRTRSRHSVAEGLSVERRSIMSRSTQHDSPANTNAARVVLGLVLGAWFIAMVLAGTAGWFVTPAGQPPLAILIAAVAPIVLFGAAYAFSEQFRSYVRAGDPVLLT